MSSTWDTVVTVAVFVLLLAPLFFVIASAPLHFMQTDGVGKDSPGQVVYLAIAMVVIPPLVAVAVYIAAVVLAWRADRPGYYPLIAGATGGAPVVATAGACAPAIQKLYRRGKRPS